jgi:hypothetical protein
VFVSVFSEEKCGKIAFLNLSITLALLLNPRPQFFTESINGCVTVRASGRTAAFVARADQLTASNIGTFHQLRSVFMWATFRIESFNAVLQLAAALFIVFSKSTMDANYAGVALNLVLSLGGFLGFIVNMVTGA